MPAITFFAMLNEAYRIKYADAKLQMEVDAIPYIKDDSARKKAVQQLEWASKHPSDILKPDNQDTNPEAIKKILAGK